MGATDAEIAKAFDVTETTINNWKKKHTSFFESIKAGREEADAKVSHSLYERALGYSHEDVDIRVVESKIVKTPIIKHYPPDPTSMIFWLKNRRPKQFREKQDVELSGEVQIDVAEIAAAAAIARKNRGL